MVECWLCVAVCRHRIELCGTVGYMKLCVDRFMYLADSRYMKLCLV